MEVHIYWLINKWKKKKALWMLRKYQIKGVRTSTSVPSYHLAGTVVRRETCHQMKIIPMMQLRIQSLTRKPPINTTDRWQKGWKTKWSYKKNQNEHTLSITSIKRIPKWAHFSITSINIGKSGNSKQENFDIMKWLRDGLVQHKLWIAEHLLLNQTRGT